MKSWLMAALLAVTGAALAPAQTQFDLHEVHWTLRPTADAAELRVEMRLAPLADRQRLLLRIPLWRPGSYRYANYQERISGLVARDHEGRERAIQRLDPRTWEIDVAGAEALRVHYAVRTDNQADDGATPVIHLHGPAVFLYSEDCLPLSQSLRVELPDGWDFASGHRPDPLAPGSYRVPNYDVLVDCPMLFGGLERHSFPAHGVPIEVVLAGRMPSEAQFPRREWLAKVAAIVDAAYSVVGDLPFERYVFLFLFSNIGGGYGLEHLNSTTIEFNHLAVKNGAIEGLESVTAHEFFHLWNVKRIRPVQLGPFDYASDVRSKDLWWLEGVTSYYQDLILQRAGLRGSDGSWFWEAQAGNYRNLRGAPGWGQLSAERSSWVVWEQNQYPYISYYDQGQALGLLLDLHIRVHTGNRRSLDDVVRFLHRWVDYPEPGYRPGDLERAITAVTGWDCEAFFDRYVAGLLEYPWEEIAPAAGLSCVNREAGEPYLGLSMDSNRRLRVGAEGPAFEAGLRDEDELLQVDGKTIASRQDLRDVVAGLSPQGRVAVLVQRGSETVEVQLAVRERRQHRFLLAPDPAAAPEAAAIARGILRGEPAGV